MATAPAVRLVPWLIPARPPLRMAHLPSLTSEQQAVVDRVCVDNARLTITDAVAGSGKTTTVLALAVACPEKRIVQATYNALLKADVRAKAAQLGLSNLEVHSYHSIAVNYYARSAYSDAWLARIVEDDMSVRQDCAMKDVDRPIDVLVVDETQDMTPLFLKLLLKLVRDTSCGHAMQVVVLGDRYQGIYGFRDADTRFLTLAHRIWSAAEGQRDCCCMLSQSHRLTDTIARYVNRAMVGFDRISASRAGAPVQYVVCNAFTAHAWVAARLLGMMRRGEIVPEDVFVLTYSLRGARAPYKRLENALVAAGVPVHVPNGDEARGIDEKVTAGKVAFSTFHQAKGRERPVVVVYGFDAGFYKYYARDEPREVCPPVLYVAATRASRLLILLQDADQGPLPFLRAPAAEAGAEVVDARTHGCGGGAGKRGKKKTNGPETQEDPATVTPTGLVRHLHQSIVAELAQQVSDLFEVERSAQWPAADVPASVEVAAPAAKRRKRRGGGGNRYTVKKGAKLQEEVADLAGVAIPAMVEASVDVAGWCELERSVRSSAASCQIASFKRAVSRIPRPPVSCSHFLELANVHAAVSEGLHGKLRQMTSYDWLGQQAVDICTSHIRQCVLSTDQARFEVDADTYVAYSGDMVYRHADWGALRVRMRVDVDDGHTVWELKVTSSLQVEHLLQVVVVAWAWRTFVQDHAGPRRFRILNARTGEVRALRDDVATERLAAVVETLLSNKYGRRASLDDDAWLASLKLPGDADGLSTAMSNVM